MKTFLSDIFPKISKFSKELDILTLINNHHWVSIEDLTLNKKVFIFRSNSELLVSTNGIVSLEKWEYLGNNFLLINIESKMLLLKHVFLDENILVLKVDSSDEYAIFVNENRYKGELDSYNKVIEFLKVKYLNNENEHQLRTTNDIGKIITDTKVFEKFNSDKGVLSIQLLYKNANPCMNNKVLQNGDVPQDGKYKLGFMNYIHVKDGEIVDLTIF